MTTTQKTERISTMHSLILCALALTTATAFAGPSAKKVIEPEPDNPGNWCSWLQDKPGRLYKNKKNPYIQELQVFGRFHWQYAYVDGEGSIGKDQHAQKFNYDTEEIRRFRLGAKLKFLKIFEANANINLSNDLSPIGGPRKVEYFNLYSATLGTDLVKAFDLDSIDELEFRIGKEKIAHTSEGENSSRFIKTVERSSLNWYIATPSSTGMILEAENGPWDLDLGMYSGDLQREFSNFNNDYFYTLHAGYKFKTPSFADKSRIDMRMLINGDEKENAVKNPESIGSLNQKWFISLSSESKKGRFELLTDLVYGDNGTDYGYDFDKDRPENNPDREGTFWGFTIIPSYWLIEDKLEGVFRYQYARASEKEGFRMAGRYARTAGVSQGFTGPNDLSNGRGDKHQSAYLGFNYYFCGDNAKVMTGIEYDDLDSASQSVYEGTTVWAAFRMYF